MAECPVCLMDRLASLEYGRADCIALGVITGALNAVYGPEKLGAFLGDACARHKELMMSAAATMIDHAGLDRVDAVRRLGAILKEGASNVRH